jgi:hypothetical protein
MNLYNRPCLAVLKEEEVSTAEYRKLASGSANVFVVPLIYLVGNILENLNRRKLVSNFP